MANPKSLDESYDASFEERADFLKPSDLLDWNVECEFFRSIQKHLTGRGAKLLVGPRGCGKTHQIRLAHSRCLRNKSKPFSVYVSFGNYLWLEPRLSKSAAAILIFHTWVLGKIWIGIAESCDELGVEVEIPIGIDRLKQFTAEIEKGLDEEWHDDVVKRVTIPSTIQLINSSIERAQRERAVLLLDDAALTLTPEYMIEFFEIFRSLKTYSISPKASVYPGTTEYGPRFHVGHDATSVNCWMDIEDPSYGRFMEDLLSSRLAQAVPQDVGALFKYAAFGIPRILISLVRSFEQSKETKNQKKFNQAVQERTEQIRAEYFSLAKKLPQYKTLIEAGWSLFTKCVDDLADENRKLKKGRQLLVGIQPSKEMLLAKCMTLVREVGLFYDKGEVRHGDRNYDRYIPHMLFLVEERAFSSSRGFTPAEDAARIASGLSPKHPMRRTFSTLIPKEIQNLQIDAPRCQNCDASRLSAEQRFCHNCGRELVRASTFEACMRRPIEELGLPDYQLRNLKAATNIKTIQDIFTQTNPATELRKAYQVGRVRSENILATAKRFVEEYLER